MADEELNQDTSPAEGAAPEAEAVAPAPVAEDSAKAGAAEPAAPEAPPLEPKARRQSSRAAKAGKVAVRVPLTPAERQAARDGLRAQKAAARRGERARVRAKYKVAEHERSATPPREHVAGNPKTRQGVVVSDRADKTITVRIDVARRHRRYEKVVRTSNTVHVHDEANDAHIGDTVVVRECRPLSRTKRWRLIEVVERAR